MELALTGVFLNHLEEEDLTLKFKGAGKPAGRKIGISSVVTKGFIEEHLVTTMCDQFEV
jgi:hypothetical protein